MDESDANGIDVLGLDGKVVETASDNIRGIVERARPAAKWWASFSIRQRGQHLRKYRDLLLDRMEDLVQVAVAETNKPRFDVIGEVIHSCDVIGYFAKNAHRMLKARSVRPHLFLNKTAEIHYRPYGVVGIITPWNYPIVLVLSPVTQALMAGNAVILKPSEHVTKTALLLQEMFRQLDLPEPVFQIVTGGPPAAVHLASSGVDKIAFTGGQVGGQAIATAAAKTLTPVLLELGGNDAMLVAADADIERAAHAAVWGSFFNAGQSCIAVERCFVEASVADRFLRRVTELTTDLIQRPAGNLDPNGRDHDLGPIISVEQAERLTVLVHDAVDKGAVIAAGGIPSAESRTMFPPTVLSGVMPSMRVMREEIFGPVLAVMRVASIEEAVHLANHTPMGLSASIWTKDMQRARAMAAGLEVGGVVVNDCLTHFGITELPFGGVKRSGYGRTQGREGLLEFCTTQTITRHRFGPRREIQWFPAGNKHKWLSRIARLLFRSGLREKLRRPPGH